MCYCQMDLVITYQTINNSTTIDWSDIILKQSNSIHVSIRCQNTTPTKLTNFTGWKLLAAPTLQDGDLFKLTWMNRLYQTWYIWLREMHSSKWSMHFSGFVGGMELLSTSQKKLPHQNAKGIINLSLCRLVKYSSIYTHTSESYQ